MHLPVLSHRSAAGLLSFTEGTGIASTPPGAAWQHPAGKQASTVCLAERGALSTDPPGIWRGVAVPRSQPQSQLCPVAFQQPPTCLNPGGAIMAVHKAGRDLPAAGHPGMGKPLVGSWPCTEGLLWALGKIHLCKSVAKVMVGWDGVTSRDLALRCWSTCRVDRGVCQGRVLPREWSQQALATQKVNSQVLVT